MRWLLIALLVSLAALLIAAAGGAWHIWLQRAALRSYRPASAGKAQSSASSPSAESDVEEVETKIL